MNQFSTEFRAVLYDLDGTLLDTIGDISAAANSVLRRHGYPTHDPEEYRTLVGWGLAELMRRCIPEEELTQQLLDSCTAEFKAEYAAHPVARTHPYEGVIAVVRELKRRGYAQAVLSNKAHEITTIIVERMLPAGVFEIVQGHKSSVPAKPDPQAALAICEALRLRPPQVLYVGDTAVDMETARSANMVAYGVSWGFRGPKEMIDAGAAHIINSPFELLDLLPATGPDGDGRRRA
ncbi:HAD family hydrolase [Salinispira pacifica]